jgi:hypothetical protein
MNTDALYLIIILLLATLLAHYLSKYYQLVRWLKNQAPMTWETYQRLGTGYKCNHDCRQGRDCPNR